MGRRKVESHNIRKITKVAGGDSFAVILPIEMVRKLRWKEKQRVVVILEGKKIIITDWRSPAKLNLRPGRSKVTKKKEEINLW